MFETSVVEPGYKKIQREAREAEKQRINRMIFSCVCFASGAILLFVTGLIFVMDYGSIVDMFKVGNLTFLLMPLFSVFVFLTGAYGMHKCNVPPLDVFN